MSQNTLQLVILLILSVLITLSVHRVPPLMTLEDLRTQITEQLSDGDILPHEYVFLRCVGRCLAIVIIFNYYVSIFTLFQIITHKNMQKGGRGVYTLNLIHLFGRFIYPYNANKRTCSCVL